jgi:CTP:phosphocholine cytidylyltransferase-like protein
MVTVQGVIFHETYSLFPCLLYADRRIDRYVLKPTVALRKCIFLKSSQQSEYSAFHELMFWQSLTFRLSNVMSPSSEEISYTMLQVG